ncbi:hypothetical protein PABG_00290 [Paracoccidioides brasiliensis Pb03]|nr:hypothetical protein PABG_00290 [Paracoccidioides brasiliensis Pb03]
MGILRQFGGWIEVDSIPVGGCTHLTYTGMRDQLSCACGKRALLSKPEVKINHPEEFKYRNATLQCRPTSKHFNLTKPSYDLFRGQNLRENCVQQSFAFDNINRRLLVAQLRDSTGDAGHFCISTARYLQKVYRPHTPE